MCTLCVLGGDVGMSNITGRVFRVSSVTSKFFKGARDKIHV